METSDEKIDQGQCPEFQKPGESLPYKRMIFSGIAAMVMFVAMMGAIGYYLDIPLDDKDYYYQLVLGMSFACFVSGAWISSGLRDKNYKPEINSSETGNICTNAK
jgi:hypothetical protein